MKWISVKTQKPPIHRDVLMYIKQSKEDGYFHIGSHLYAYTTHWAELEEPTDEVD